MLGVRVHQLQTHELFNQVCSLVSLEGKHLITYVNVHAMNVAHQDKAILEAYERSAITYCDGGGVVLAARLLGESLPMRMTSASFIYDFCDQWQDTGTSLFFLGGQPLVAEKACNKLKALYPRLSIAGYENGYFRRNDPEEDEVISKISNAHPDILFVGFGTPSQEHWILDNWDRLNARIIWPIGALVDYISGEVPRSPRWMQDYTLEWLFRLMIEPKRMFRRYVVGNPYFMYRILRERFQSK